MSGSPCRYGSDWRHAAPVRSSGTTEASRKAAGWSALKIRMKAGLRARLQKAADLTHGGMAGKLATELIERGLSGHGNNRRDE